MVLHGIVFKHYGNDYVLADPHYTDAGHATAAAGPQRSKQVEENITILRGAPIYEVFLANVWASRSISGNPGIVPLKMTTLDGYARISC